FEHIDACADCRSILTEIVRAGGSGDVDRPAAKSQPAPIGFAQRISAKPWVRQAPPTQPSSPLDDLVPGLVVAERYRLERQLGEGGKGVVWAATHLLLGSRVALKFLKPGESAEDVRRFLREGRIATQLRHPHIVEVTDLFALPTATQGGP